MFPKTVFWIGAKGGLVEQKHRRRMGEAIWLFLWLLLRQTDLNEEGEGVVFYGRPLSIRAITADTRFPVGTLHRWIDQLIEQDYIRTDKQAEGSIFWILKAKNKKKGVPRMEQEKPQGVPDMEQKCSKNGTQKLPNPHIPEQLNENATNISSISQNHYNKDAAAKAAAEDISFRSLLKSNALPQEKSSVEIEARRAYLMEQAKRLGIGH